MRVISFNIENGGANTNTTPRDFVDILFQQYPDVLVMQETWYRTKTQDMISNTAEEIAKQMGMHFYQASTPYGVAIATREPILKIYDHPTLAEENRICGVVTTVRGVKINVFGIHMNDWPSEHYTLRGFDYYDTIKPESIEQAVTRSWNNRKIDLENIFALLDNEGPCIIAGDFNEPSHLDWTLYRKDLPIKAIPAPWQSSRYLLEKGFQDAARVRYPDPVKEPFFTNNVVRVYQDEQFTGPPERIDYIYYRKLSLNGYYHMLNAVSDHLPIVADFEL